jgi:hypothetical protein
MANPPFQSPQVQPESGVRGNVPAPFGAGERLQSPTYRYLGGSNPARLPGTRHALWANGLYSTNGYTDCKH